MKLLVAIISLALPVLFLVFGLPNKENQTIISIAGSSTLAPLISEIAKKYEKENPGIRIDVQTGGSSRGITDTREGRIDLGMVSRSPKSEETDISWYPVAKDGIGIIIHKSNPLTGLTKDKLVQIYEGKITNWKAIGGNSSKLYTVHKAAGRSTQEVFLKYVKLSNSQIESSLIIGDNQQGIKTIAGNPNAIGYVSIGSAEVAIEEGVPIKFLAIDGQTPSTIAVSEGSYDISRTLHIVSTKNLDGAAKDFIEYASSKEVNEIIGSQYFVPIQL